MNTESSPQLTPQELHILRHSLGLDDNGNGNQYRNYYCTDPVPELVKLCDMGLMWDRGAQEIYGGMHVYHVTERGKRVVNDSKPAPKKISRSKRRYLDFLHADSGMSFGEWIRLPSYER